VKGSQPPALCYFFSSAVQFAVAALGVVLTASFYHQLSTRLDALSLPPSERQAIERQRAKLGLSRPMTSVNGTRWERHSWLRIAMFCGSRSGLHR
jgi:hypothetical protein